MEVDSGHKNKESTQAIPNMDSSLIAVSAEQGVIALWVQW